MLIEEGVTAYLELARWDRLAESKDKEKLAALIKAAAEGDSDASGELFSLYQPKLVSIVRSQSGLDRNAAEDAVQDIMLKTLLQPKWVKKFATRPHELIRGLARAAINQGHDIRGCPKRNEIKFPVQILQVQPCVEVQCLE